MAARNAKPSGVPELSRLRIAHVTATFPPYWAGTGNVAYHNALQLARRGHEVSVLTADYPTDDPEPTGVRVRRLSPLLRVGNAPVLPQLLALDHVDLIHLHSPFVVGSELVWLAATLRRIPFVLTYHNDLIGDGMRRFLFHGYASVSNRLIVGGARAIAVVSLDHALACRSAPLFRRRLKDVVEIPNGVDTDVFHPDLDGMEVRSRHGIPAGAGLILFVGALDRAHHFKGVPHLLVTLARLRHRDAQLMLVGDGDLKESFVCRASELGLADRVCFVGAVAHRDLAPYYAAADVVVLPSFPPESFGLVLIEAMACGRAVVANDIPGVRSVIAHGSDGFLARAGDASDLAEKIDALLAERTLRERFGSAGRRKAVTRYDWRSVGARLEDFYRRALGLADTVADSADVVRDARGE